MLAFLPGAILENRWAIPVGVALSLAAVPASAGTWTQATQTDFAGGTATNVDVSAPQGALSPSTTRAIWWNAAWSYRMRVDVNAGAVARTDFPFELELDFPAVLSANGIPGTFDPASVRVVEIDGAATALLGEKPGRYEHSSLNGKGVLFTVLDGSTAAGAVRSFHVYFDVTQALAKPAPGYWSNATTPLLENAAIKLDGINQNQYQAEKAFGLKDLIVKSNGADTMYVRFAKLSSSLGTYGTSLDGYSTCGTGSTQCTLAATNFGSGTAAMQLVDSPSLKITRVEIPAGAITIREYFLLTTGNGFRIYNRFENTGATVASAINFWDGADIDILGTSASDDSGAHNADGSIVISDATPAAVGQRATVSPSAWDLDDRVDVMDAIRLEAPGSQASLNSADVGFGTRYLIPDIAPQGFAVLKLAYAAATTPALVQSTLANYAVSVSATNGAVESRCNNGAGTFTSSVFDSLTASADWLTIAWSQGLPSGTGVSLSTRSGSSPVPDGSWTPWSSPAYTNASGEAVAHPSARYLQYQVTLTPSAAGACPTVDDVGISYDGPAVGLTVTEIPDPLNAGQSTSLRVTAVEPAGGAARSYTGTVSFTSTDPAASLPGGITFTPGDQGTRLVVGLVLATTGAQTVTATDSAAAFAGSQTVNVRGKAQVRYRWYDEAGTVMGAENAQAAAAAGQRLQLRVAVSSIGAQWKLASETFSATGETRANAETLGATFSATLAQDGASETLTEGSVGNGKGWWALGDTGLAGRDEHAWHFGTAIPAGLPGYQLCFLAKTSGEHFLVGWSATAAAGTPAYPTGWAVTATSLTTTCFDLKARGYNGGALTVYAQDLDRGNNQDSVTSTLSVDGLYVRAQKQLFVGLERANSTAFTSPVQVGTAELWDDTGRANGALLTAALSGTSAPQVQVETRPSLTSNQVDVGADGQAEWNFPVVVPTGGGTHYYRLVFTGGTGTKSGGPDAYPALAAVQVVQTSGGSCTQASECASGFCANGVCCDTACAGTCQACDVPGQVGTCGPALDGAACANATFCDGAESCLAGVCSAGAPVVCVDPLGEDVLFCDEASQSCAVSTTAPPVIAHDALLTAGLGQRYPYNASGRVNASGTRPLAFSTCAGPSAFRVDPASGAVRWTPDATGPVSLCVRADNANGFDPYPFTVQVSEPSGQGPTAVFTVEPGEAPAQTPFTFDGRASTADPGTPLSFYRWDFGDGTPPVFGPTVTHAYVVAGGYQAELTVTDAVGRTATKREPVRVTGAAGRRPPLARAVASATRGDGELFVTLGCDCEEGDARLVSYRWSLPGGDEARRDVTSTFLPGRYRVRLTVTDASGLWATDVVELAVDQAGDEPPECRTWVDPAGGEAPLQGVLHLSEFSDREGPTASHLLTFADGSTTGDLKMRRDYPEAGRYGARLEVTDEAGLRCVDSVEVMALSDGTLPMEPRVLAIGCGCQGGSGGFGALWLAVMAVLWALRLPARPR